MMNVLSRISPRVTTKALGKVAPRATKMIRMDHSHVFTTFHKYEIDARPSTKRALVDSMCLALDIHAQLEEEIFYPAMREVDPSALGKSEPEHDEMRRLISVLRAMDATEPSFDETVMSLMREVMHHVAHEETVLLPAAERLIPDRLDELGAQMTKRRIELSAPRAGEIAMNTARSYPGAMMAAGAGVLVIGALLAKRAIGNSRNLRLASH